MPAPCTIVFGFCWMKSGVAKDRLADRHYRSSDDHPGGLVFLLVVGVAAIVLPIVIMDHPMTILAVDAWSAPR